MNSRLLPVVAALALTAAPAFAAGGDMSVAMFLSRVDALKAKGPMALLSPDLKVLKSDGEAAGAAYRARLVAERSAGKPSSCPPKGATVSQDQVLSHLRTYPAGTRERTSMKTAMADLFIKTYPCR